jgi:energy-coupling factor transporter transmembrane protein EcfT
MEKIINFIIQTIVYFLIVLFVFFISKKVGIHFSNSIWMLAIGSTIGWLIVEGIFRVIKKNDKN